MFTAVRLARADKNQPGKGVVFFQSRRLRRKVYVLPAEARQDDQGNDTCIGVD